MLFRSSVIAETCNLDRILSLARAAPPLAVPETAVSKARPKKNRPVIAVARDAAFCFYYQDNIDRLARAGAEIREFSPVAGEIPEADAIYLGGGYPELHAAALEKSKSTKAIRSLAEDGMPVYGECGGLMYLCGSLETEGKEFKMAGVLPGRAVMTKRLAALGYVNGVFSKSAGLWPGTVAVRGHEFHYSKVECDRDARFAIRLRQGSGIDSGNDGLTEHAAIGAYTHAYFSDTFCKKFIAAAAAYRKNAGRK